MQPQVRNSNVTAVEQIKNISSRSPFVFVCARQVNTNSIDKDVKKSERSSESNFSLCWIRACVIAAWNLH